MKKRSFGLLTLLPLLLTGCTGVGQKDGSISIIYIGAAVLSFLLLITYSCLDRNRDKWFLLLFSSVLVVNVGYYCLSVAQNLEWALWCNRIAYLGSVFLPMSLLMIILNVTKIQYSKWVSALLAAIGVLVLLVAASPGYFGVYYSKVTLEINNGVSSLNKEYGPLHFLYLVYLLGYFGAMVTVILYAAAGNKLNSTAQAAVLLIAVFVNLCVWLIEQLVEIDFEFLSVSYVITEMFLLGLHLFLEEAEQLKASLAEQAASAAVPEQPPAPTPEPTHDPTPMAQVDPAEQQERFLAGLEELTQTERAVYDAYVQGKTTKEIMAQLNIKENTLKFHNKNLYGKLGVSSRKQLVQIYRQITCRQESR